MKYLILLFLGVNTWTDIRKREVSLTSVILLGCLGIIRMITEGGISWIRMASLATGLFFCCWVL